MHKEAIRKAYGRALKELGGKREDLLVLDADVSHSTQTYMFAEAYPERFINFGIAEANMISAAAGLATIGYQPIINTFSFLFSERGLDQIRSSIVYNKLNVKIVGNYGGLSDSFDGASHHSLSDLAIIRSIPDIALVVASDAMSVEKVLAGVLDYEGPVYLRLCRAETPVIHDENYDFELGKGRVMVQGDDVTIVATGVMLHRALEAGKVLKEQGIQSRIIEIHTIKPLDRQLIEKAATETRGIVVCEEANIMGGLGGAVAEAVVEAYPCPMEFVGVQDTYAESGPYEALLDKYGMSVEDIVSKAKKVYNRRNK